MNNVHFIASIVPAVIFISCGGNNTVMDQVDSTLHMRPPVPVIVETPSWEDDLKLPPGTCVIVVRDQDWLFIIHSDSTVANTAEEFRATVKANGGSTQNGKIALQADSKATSRIDETIALLKKDSIVQFNLITDLEK